jgi:hypothetical protein
MMAGKTQGTDENSAAFNAQEQAKHHEIIKQLAEMSDAQAITAIRENASRDVGAYGANAVAAAELNTAQEVAKYRDEHKVYVTGFADVLVRKEVAVSVNADKHGVQNTTFSGQTDVGSIGGANLFAGASGTLNNEGNLTSGSAWINAAAPVYDAGVAKIIPVGQVKATATTTGDFGPQNISGTAGVVINPDGTKANVVGLIGGAIGGGSINLTANYSQDLPLGNGVIVTPNVGVTQDVLKGNTSVSGGVRAHDPHLFDPTTGGAIALTANGTSLQNNPDYGVNVQASVTFGNAATNNAPTPLEAAFMKATGRTDGTTEKDATPASAPRHGQVPSAQQQDAAEQAKASAGASSAKPSIATDKVDGRYHSTIASHADAAQDPVQAKLEHFYELPRNEQRAIVSHMTDIYVKHNPGVDHEEAQAKVLHEILNPQRNQEAEHSHG